MVGKGNIIMQKIDGKLVATKIEDGRSTIINRSVNRTNNLNNTSGNNSFNDRTNLSDTNFNGKGKTLNY